MKTLLIILILTISAFALPTRYDFDGDHKADISVFRPSTGTWYILGSVSGVVTAYQFGQDGDRPIADYYFTSGDGKTLPAVYRAGGTNFYLAQNYSGAALGFTLGYTPADIPVPANYDPSTLQSEPAFFRNGLWRVQKWGFQSFFGDIVQTQFGLAGDIPQPKDFDGDHQADFAVFRPSDRTWYVLGSTAGFSAVQFGLATDLPVAADYDGDGRADIAVFRPSDGNWYILGSQAGFYAMHFGISTDRPVPADYDGDNRTDIAVYRDGTWYIQASTTGFTATQFGLATDIPVPEVPHA